MTRSWLSVLILICLLVGVAGIWSFSEPKSGAVLGRLDYYAFYGIGACLIVSSMAVFFVVVPRRWRRPLLFRLLAAGFAFVITLTLTEVACWLVPARHVMDNPFYAMDKDSVHVGEKLPYVRPPHLSWTGTSRGDIAILSGDPDPWERQVTFKTDHQGFRNSQDLDRADIVFIGDSFTEAGYLPEEETFPQLVGQNLNRTVRNLGRAGYAGATELIVLREYGVACEPKLVVWQICEANDLDDSVLIQDWIAKGRPADFFIQKKDPHQTRMSIWKRRSPTYQIFCLFRGPNWDFAGEYRDSNGQIHPVYFLRTFGTGQSPGEHPGWPPLKESILQAKALLEKHNIPWIVLYIPMKTRVLADYVAFNEWTRHHSKGWGYPRTSMEDTIAHLCRENGIAFVSATVPLVSATARGSLVYLPMDTHLSAAGHRVVSDTISPLIALKLQEQPTSATNFESTAKPGETP